MTTCVAIAGCKVTLRCSTITIATPGGDEGGKMTVIGVEGDTVVSIPGITYGLLGAMGEGPCLMEGGLGVVGLSGCMEVEWPGSPLFCEVFQSSSGKLPFNDTK